MRSPHKDIRPILKVAQDLGWYVKRYGKHIQLGHPLGYSKTIPCTPKNGTAVRKIEIRNLKKYDYKEKK